MTDGASDSSAAPATPREPSSRAPRGLLRRVRTALSFFRRSLLLRVIVLTLVFSTVVMVGLGVILQQQITDGLLQSKIDAAIAEIENARSTAQVSLSGADSDPTTLGEQLRSTVAELGRPAGPAGTGAQGSTAGVFDPVLVPSRGGSDAALAVGPLEDVPAQLRVRVSEGSLSYQYATLRRDGGQLPALVVGTPVTTTTDSFELYLIFPLGGEQGTVAVVQRTLVLGGLALAFALTLIAGLVAFQVVRPVRRAAGVAERLAAGDLAERMPVKGPIELTTLARSFNGMAEAIRAQIRQLEEFGKLQRRFTSDVSHELRTPLTTVRMAADLLHSSREEFPSPLARSTELLVAELDRFESLLADLLEISRHDAGMAELSAESIDVRSRIVSAVQAAEPLAELAGVDLQTILPATAVVAELDTRRVDRILRNLINNAIDHAEGQPIQIELAATDTVLAITVTDSGVGLRPGEAGLVFNRFWRADPSRQRQTGGTGLGLAISLEDARLHGGWLQASGSPGQGARFRLTLPRHPGVLIGGSPLALRVDGSDTDDEGAPGQPFGSSSLTRRVDLAADRAARLGVLGPVGTTGPAGNLAGAPVPSAEPGLTGRAGPPGDQPVATPTRGAVR